MAEKEEKQRSLCHTLHIYREIQGIMLPPRHARTYTEGCLHEAYIYISEAYIHGYHAPHNRSMFTEKYIIEVKKKRDHKWSCHHIRHTVIYMLHITIIRHNVVSQAHIHDRYSGNRYPSWKKRYTFYKIVTYIMFI